GYFIGLSGPGGYWTVLVMEFAVYLAVGLPFYFLVIKPGMHKGGPLKEKDFRLVMLTFVVLASSIVLSIFATRAESPDFVSEVVCRLYAIIGCSLTLFMQFGVAKESRLHAEKLVMEQLLHMEHRQHEISRETIDIINLKCHDIKHQIDALATVNDAAERKAALDEFGGVVLIYDGMLKTENDTLDLVLTEKSLICGQYGIKLNCIADGKSIGFLGKTDIYTLFGNAIDNAVECIRREDADKRFINLSVLRKDEMLFIHIDNFCADSVVFEDGLPVTTKADKQYHGFGTKSIKYIAQKYGGEARMGVQNSRFNLDVFLPAAF
ncbi:MAG: ATP-binding protein, partial [Clostridiales bacterium]|nr:ATP-binding protein [Clostridiales bacterium]